MVGRVSEAVGDSASLFLSFSSLQYGQSKFRLNFAMEIEELRNRNLLKLGIGVTNFEQMIFYR